MQGSRWLVVLVILLWGCTGSTTPGARPPEETTTSTSATSTTPLVETTAPSNTTTVVDESTQLRMGTLLGVESLDPADALTYSDWEILLAINEGLLRREPGDGTLLPGIATGLPEVAEDGLSYTFELKPDLEFADGTPLTAPLYVESIERVMRLGGRNSDLVTLYVSDVQATDDTTVVFHLRDRFAFFPTLVTTAPYYPAHPEAFPGDELAPLPEAPVYGVGPWSLASYSETEIVLDANPHYESDEPRPGRIFIRTFETSAEASQALIGEHIDFLWRGVDQQSAATLSESGEVNVESIPGGTLHFLTVNHGLAPTDDPLVRQAIAELIDREAISDAVLGGAFVPAFSPVPPGYVGSSDSFTTTYGEPDVNQAITLLTEAGYTESEPAAIQLAYPPEQFGLNIAPAMEELELQIESTGLVDLTLTAQPWNAYVGDVVDGTYNLAFLGWLHDYPDTHNYLAPFVLDGGVGGSGQNLTDPEIVDLLNEAAMTLDAEERAGLYEQAQTMFAQDVVTVPLWIEHPYIAYGDSVAGSDAFANRQSLNVGAGLILDFRSLQLQAPENGD